MEFKVPLYGKKKKCIVCGCSVGSKGMGHIKKAYSVGVEKAVTIWMEKQIVIHHNHHKLCNICQNLKDFIIETVYSSDILEISNILELLTNSLKKKLKTQIKEDKIEEMDKKLPLLDVSKLLDEECKECCGLTEEKLRNLSEISGSSIQVIFEFFCKCRHKISDRFGGILFQKDKATISHNFGNVLKSLTESFVPKWIGSSAFTRESTIKENISYLFQEILPNIREGVDGTYFHIEKSSVFNVQRKTYNSHKGRNLLKEMAIILPNGRFFDLIGPFFSDGDHNDE